MAQKQLAIEKQRDEAAEGGSGANKRGEALNKAGRVSVQPTGRTQRGRSDVARVRGGLALLGERLRAAPLPSHLPLSGPFS